MISLFHKRRERTEFRFAPPEEVWNREDSKDRGRVFDMTPVKKAIYMTAGVATLATISQNVGGGITALSSTTNDDVYVGTVTRDEPSR